MIEALDAENDELAALPTGVVLESRTEFSEHKLAELHLPELSFGIGPRPQNVDLALDRPRKFDLLAAFRSVAQGTPTDVPSVPSSPRPPPPTPVESTPRLSLLSKAAAGRNLSPSLAAQI